MLTSDDPEALHDLRVAIRRARRAVQSFSAFLGAETVRLERPLHDLFHRLGTVRDLDIALALLSEIGCADEVRERLSEARSGAKSSLIAVLPKGTVDKLIHEATSSKVEGPLVSVPVKAAAPDLLEASFKKARRAAKNLSDDSEAAEIHLLRRRAKRLRDELGFFSPLYREPAKAVAASLKQLQDLLGTHQDLVITEEILEGLTELSELSTEAVVKVQEAIGQRRKGLRKAILEQARSFGGKDWKKLDKWMARDRRELWKGGGKGDKGG